jgi:hypothetical protein
MAKNIIIVDIDGTISRPAPERMQHFGVDWNAFYSHDFNDQPIPEMVELVKSLSKRYTLVFCTSRSERCRIKTLNWFDRQGIPYDNKRLLMRDDKDERPAEVVKLDLLADAGIRVSRIAFALEDDLAVTKEYLQAGIPVLLSLPEPLRGFMAMTDPLPIGEDNALDTQLKHLSDVVGINHGKV